MSTKGIYTALSGAIAQSQKLDTIANNLANVNTNSFKKDRQVFNEYLTANEKSPDVIQAPRVPASIESFYDMQGGDKSYVNSAGTYTDFAQGALSPTGNPMDVAIEGPGFYEVLTPQGIHLSRDGSMKIDGLGRLVTKQGYPVLSAGQGQPPEARVIRLGSRNITVSFSGEVFDQGVSKGKLSLLNVKKAEALQKSGNNLYALKPNYGQQLIEADKLKIHQGFVEKSNVNVVSEMTDMIATSRVFQSTQQAMKAFDLMNGKMVNEVGRLK